MERFNHEASSTEEACKIDKETAELIRKTVKSALKEDKLSKSIEIIAEGGFNIVEAIVAGYMLGIGETKLHIIALLTSEIEKQIKQSNIEGISLLAEIRHKIITL